MSPIVHGRWYSTLAEGYADSPFFRGEVKGCVHIADRFETGEPCPECERIHAEQDRVIHEPVRRFWAARDAYDALPWWSRLFRHKPRQHEFGPR